MLSLFNLSKMWIYIMISLLTLARCRRMGGEGYTSCILCLTLARCEGYWPYIMIFLFNPRSLQHIVVDLRYFKI